MAGTLPSILRLIRDGDTTFAEVTVRLGITREQLENRLRLMERQGYILRQSGTSDTPACSCGHCRSPCRETGGGKVPVIYALTRKGEDLVRDLREK